MTPSLSYFDVFTYFIYNIDNIDINGLGKNGLGKKGEQVHLIFDHIKWAS